MGGLADLSRPLPCRDGAARDRRRRPSAPRPSASHAEEGSLVRRVRVDLGPFLERAGAGRPADSPGPGPAPLPAAPGRPGRAGGGARTPWSSTSRPWGCAAAAWCPSWSAWGRPRGALPGDRPVPARRPRRRRRRCSMPSRPGSALAGSCSPTTGAASTCRCCGRGASSTGAPADAVSPPIHCDLLGPVRRLFRERLGACTLRQAEVCAARPRARRRRPRGGGARPLPGLAGRGAGPTCWRGSSGTTSSISAPPWCWGRGSPPMRPAGWSSRCIRLTATGWVSTWRPIGFRRRRRRRSWRRPSGRTSSPWSRPAGHRLARRLAP